MSTERIIKEGRTLRKSSKVIAQEVERYIIEKLVRDFIDGNKVDGNLAFFGKADLAKFREFIENGSKEKKV